MYAKESWVFTRYLNIDEDEKRKPINEEGSDAEEDDEGAQDDDHYRVVRES